MKKRKINDVLKIAFEKIIEPHNFIKNFKNKKEFEEWLKTGSKKDLECILLRYEKAELYEICEIIKNIIQ